MNTKNQYLKTGNFWKVIMLIMGVSAMTFFVLARLSFAQSEAEDIAPVKEQLQPLEEPSRQLEPAQAETVQNALEAETETQIKKANDGIKNSEIKDLALELGLFQPTEEFREIEQKDDTIKITGKILLGTARPASSKEGLSIVKGDIENRRDEILFFEEQGKRKETIKLADLISEAQKDQLSEASLTPSAQRAIEVGSGDTTATLSAALRGLERREDIKVNVEGIEVRKKGADFFEKVTKSIFKPQKDEVKDEEKRYEIEVSNTGEVKLLKAEAVQGNEELEIEYSYGVFSSPFQINSVFLSLKEPLAVDTLSAKQVEKVANKIEENALKFFSDIKDKKTPAPAEQEVETAPVNETSGEETAPSIEEVPQEEPAQSEPVVEEEIASEEVPVPPQNPKPEEEVQPASQSEGEVSASEAPQPPVEEKDISMPPISKINALKSAARSVFEIITKRFSLERDGGNMFIESARAQTTSVEAFQIKLKAATSKGEQTFQILPDGTVYLYHGSSIEAISKPKVQFLQDARWSDYTITRAQVGTLSDELTAVHIIKLDTLEEDEITLKYDFGLKEGVLLKKQTWQVDSDKTVRAVWETFLRPGSKSEKALQQRVSRNAPKTRTTLYENIVIDTADYPGNVEIEEIPEDHIVRVYFEKEGIQAPFVVDPSFSVITSDSFIEVATPDYLDAESQDGWKVRFNKLFGGTIDGYYRNSVDNGITNIASSAKPLFNIAYTNAEVFKDSAQQSAQVMEVLERGDTRVRVHSKSILGADTIDVFYTVYLAGQIYIDVEHVLSDGAITGQDGVFQVNQSYAGYQANFPMVDTNVKSAGIDATQSDTALIAFEPGEIGSVTSSASETGDYIQVALGTDANGNYGEDTANHQFLLDLSFDGAADELSDKARDYQTPDSLTPFTIGAYQGYNNKEGAYEMTAIGNKVEFRMDGASQTRYQPIFKLANWNIPGLAIIYAALDNGEIIQNVDYIITFQNGDPNTHTLVFQYLKNVGSAVTFYIDPACTSQGGGGNWTDTAKWDCGVVPDSDDTVIIASGSNMTFNVAGATTVISITINSGATLNFDTAADRDLTIAGDVTVNGTFQCRGSSSATTETTLRLNGSDGTPSAAEYGLIVSTTGFLDWQGQAQTDQDCIITASDTATPYNGYIYLQDGSETLIKNAEISYMGANADTKYGITAKRVNGNVANEGLVVEGSVIRNSYYGIADFTDGSYWFVIRDNTFHTITQSAINLASVYGVYGGSHLIANNTIYSVTNGVYLNGYEAVSTVIGNIVNEATSYGIHLGNGNGNYAYNNTLNANGTGIGGRPIRMNNNLITNSISYAIGLITANSLISGENNYRFGGATGCHQGGNACPGTITWSANSGSNPNYVSTTGTDPDFLHLQANSPTLADGKDFFNNTLTPCGASRNTACANVGARMDYVVNDNPDNSGSAGAQKYNWLQQAHDATNVLSAGDTVTAYANNVVSDTIHTTPNLSNVGSIGTAYYQVKFDLQNTDRITAADQHEGFYAYFTSGANRGRYYLIIDTVQAATDTMTILSPQSSSTFTAGDGFSVVDRVYAREAGGLKCTTTTENLCITKGGTAASPITWTTNGTVILDGGNSRSYGIQTRAPEATNAIMDYNRIAGFHIINSVTAGLYIIGMTRYSKFDGNYFFNNNYGIYAINNGSGYPQHNTIDGNTFYNNTTNGIYLGNAPFTNILNNTVIASGNNGIHISTGSNNSDYRFVGNLLAANGGSGLANIMTTTPDVDISRNISWGNTNYGILLQGLGGPRVRIKNNTSVGNKSYGIYLVNIGSNYPNTVTLRNNLISENTTYGLREGGGITGTNSDFNYYYNNGTNAWYESASDQDANSINAATNPGTDPGFYFEVSAAVLAGATTAMVDLTGTQAWTENQWVGAGLTFTGVSCPADVLDKWFGITSNTAERLFYSPTPASAPDTNCTGKLTNFYLTSTTSATTPLGNGASHAGSAKPDCGSSINCANMGSRLGFLRNSDTTKSNAFQTAAGDASTSAGDTLTAYAFSEVATATVKTSAGVTDNGPYLTLTLDEDVISANDDYIGYYYYVSSGDNAGNYYLIIDSVNGGGAGTDTISINTAQDNSFASDIGKIIDRVYTGRGWTNGIKTAVARFTKDGASGSVITWQAGASNTILIDAESAYTYVFYGDTDGTDGLKYNNFVGPFTLKNSTSATTLYQSGFGFSNAVTHQKVNWAGTTDAETIFQGTYISPTIDMGASAQFSQLVWDETATADVSDAKLQIRTANVTPIASGNFLGPDGATGTYYNTSSGEDIHSSHDANRYVQYKVYVSTINTATIPSINEVSIGQDALTLSSAFDSRNSGTMMNDLTWTETNGAGGALPSKTNALFQMRTAPDSSASPGTPGTWSSWCGPETTPSVLGSCSSTTFFTDATGISEEIDDILKDGTNDQWLQYRVYLIQNGPSSSKPYVQAVNVVYDINTPPSIAITSAGQSANGTVAVGYTIADVEEGYGVGAHDGNVVVGLYYERGDTITANATDSTLTITVSTPTNLPSNGTFLIDNEIITYGSITNGNIVNVIARNAESSKAASHTSAAAIWIKAGTGATAGNTGTISGVNAAPAAKTITWTAKTDLNGLYDATMQTRVVGNDGNIANQVGYGTGTAFALDVKDPTSVNIAVDASGASTIATTVTVTPSASDNNAMTMIISNNSGFIADGVNVNSGISTPFSNTPISGWKLESIPDTVYIKVTDALSNSATASGTTPSVLSNLIILEASNLAQTTPAYRLFISWDAASAPFANYHIYRKTGAGGSYGAEPLASVNDRLINYYTDATVSANTVYVYKASVEDDTGNISFSSVEMTGNANNTQDGSEGSGLTISPPVITFDPLAQITSVSNSRATITFTTDVISDSAIDFTSITPVNFSATTTESQGSPTMIDAGLPHSITLIGLKLQTTYYFRIRSRGANGLTGTKDNCASSCYSFTTTNATGPTISNVQTIIINPVTIDIVWTTDKDSSTQVVYSQNANLSNGISVPVSAGDTAPRVKSHRVQITNLASQTTYYYKVISVDAGNNTAELPQSSPFYAFNTTDAQAPLISGVEIKSITATSATVTFATNEVASASIEYGISAAYGTSLAGASLNMNHVFTLASLAPQTGYFFKVSAADASGNTDSNDNNGAGYSFTTLEEVNEIISNVRANFVSATAVDITWTTTTALNSQVAYSLNSALTSATLQPLSASDSVTSHTVSLTSLAQSTRYYYKVKSGTNESPIYNFLTGDTTAPVISAVSVAYNDVSAVITWTTNELAGSQVEYGLTENYRNITAEDTLLTLSHSVTLTALEPATTYHYRIRSKDGLRNLGTSVDANFTTDAGTSALASINNSAPIISSISVVYNDIAAVVSWTTNKDTTSQVSYGLDTAYGTNTTQQATLTKIHTVRLSSLQPSTAYHYRVKSTDAIGNIVQSGDNSFTTDAGTYKATTAAGTRSVVQQSSGDTTPAEISNFRVKEVSETTITAEWETNEPTSTFLAYGKGFITDVQFKEGIFDALSLGSKVQNHLITIDRLLPGTTYVLQPIAIDAGGNLTQGKYTESTTAGVPRILEQRELLENQDIPGTTLNAEGKAVLSEKFDTFAQKLELYLGPPIIIDISAEEVTQDSVTLKWKTTVPTASILDYGASEQYGEQIKLLQFDQTHAIKITGLSPSSSYHYRIRGITETGLAVSTQDLIFSTTEIGRVSNLTVNDIQDHSAQVSWDTNVFSTSEIEYGIAEEDSLKTKGDNKLASAHTVFLTALKEKTKYRVRVMSHDQGKSRIQSIFIEFTTSNDNQPPKIKNFNAEALIGDKNKVQVFVSWLTDEPATGQVFYDIGIERGRALRNITLRDENYVTSHISVLTDFQSGVIYQIRVESFDRSGNKALSEDFTLLTPKKDKNIVDVIVDQFQDAFGFLKKK